jgi:hypothetical protein
MSGGSEGVIEAIENYEDWLDTIGEVKDEVYNLDS